MIEKKMTRDCIKLRRQSVEDILQPPETKLHNYFSVIEKKNASNVLRRLFPSFG